jgi:hypothetical protein
MPVPQSSAFARTRGDVRASQVPRQPLCEHALLFDPGGPDAPRPLTTHPMLPSAQLTASAPRSVTFRGSITQPVRSLSTLRSSDYSDRTPRKTRFPLVANLVGTGLSPAGLHQEVSTCVFNSHRFPLLEAFPGAPTAVTPSRWRPCSRLGRRAEAGPCRLHTKVRWRHASRFLFQHDRQ